MHVFQSSLLLVPKLSVGINTGREMVGMMVGRHSDDDGMLVEHNHAEIENVNLSIKGYMLCPKNLINV